MNEKKARGPAWFFILTLLVISLSIALGTRPAQAVPVLQLGLSNDGGATFVPYTTIGSDEETAFSFSATFSMWVGGAYGPNVTVLDGGNYDALSNCTGACLGTVWSPIIVASVPEGTLGTGTVTINGVVSQPFLTRTTLFNKLTPSGGVDGRIIPNHYPTEDSDSDFMFFDLSATLGLSSFAFAQNAGGVRDFADTSQTGTGQEVVVNVVISGFGRVHFDLIAIETSSQGQRIVSTIENNPFSHDVTFVPEPGTLLLLGTGLIGAAGFARRRFLKRRNRE